MWDGKDGMSGISKCGYSKVWILSHLILAFWFPDEGYGNALNDKLKRASHKSLKYK